MTPEEIIKYYEEWPPETEGEKRLLAALKSAQAENERLRKLYDAMVKWDCTFWAVSSGKWTWGINLDGDGTFKYPDKIRYTKRIEAIDAFIEWADQQAEHGAGVRG